MKFEKKTARITRVQRKKRGKSAGPKKGGGGAVEKSNSGNPNSRPPGKRKVKKKPSWGRRTGKDAEPKYIPERNRWKYKEVAAKRILGEEKEEKGDRIRRRPETFFAGTIETKIKNRRRRIETGGVQKPGRWPKRTRIGKDEIV